MDVLLKLILLGVVGYAVYRTHIAPGRRQAAVELRGALARAAREEMELERLRLAIAREQRAMAAEDAKAASAPAEARKAPAAAPARRASSPPRLEVVKPGAMIHHEVDMAPHASMGDEDILAAMEAREADREAGMR